MTGSKSNLNILLAIVTSASLLYSGLVTVFAYYIVLEEQEPEGIGKISVVIQVKSERPAFKFEWIKMAIVNKGASAYDALNSIANLSTTDYASYGKYIVGIDDANEGDSYYWFFYLWNFELDLWELSPLGVSGMKVSDGDILRFMLENRGYPLNNV